MQLNHAGILSTLTVGTAAAPEWDRAISFKTENTYESIQAIWKGRSLIPRPKLSTDGGATWSAKVRETSAQSNLVGNANGPGDYSSSTPHSGAVWPFFSDHRMSNPETSSGGAFDVYTHNIQ